MMEMQSLLRDRILGEEWWIQATLVRERRCDMSIAGQGEREPYDVYEGGGVSERLCFVSKPMKELRLLHVGGESEVHR